MFKIMLWARLEEGRTLSTERKAMLCGFKSRPIHHLKEVYG